MKIKNLEVAKKYGFLPIFQEDKLPSKVFQFSNDYTQEEVDYYNKIWEKDDEIKKENIVVSEYSDLYYFDDYLAYNIGHSRRGQYYYILCEKDTLELSIIATSPDGSGSNCNLPDILVEMILNGDVVLK